MQVQSGLGTEKRTRDRGQGNGTGDRGQRTVEQWMGDRGTKYRNSGIEPENRGQRKGEHGM
jgi:hypothetical protein